MFEPAQLQRYWTMAMDWTMIYLPKAILAIIIFLIGSRIIHQLNVIFDKGLTTRKVDATVRPFLASLVNITLKLMLILFVANIFGFETTSLVAMLSALAFAVGLALQGSLGHFASGILLLIFKPYRVGDKIKVGDNVGRVEEIQAFHTILLTDDNQRIIFPNGVVTSNRIINISGQGTLRLSLFFTVGANNSMQKLREGILAAANECEWVLKDIPIGIYVNEFNADSLKLEVQIWCDSVNDTKARNIFTEMLRDKFNDINVEAPNATCIVVKNG
jgi:small conductance mechanosensitive channel